MSLYFKTEGINTTHTSKGSFVTPWKGNVTNKRQTKNPQISQLTLLQMRKTISERHGLTQNRLKSLSLLSQAILSLPTQESGTAGHTELSQI